MAKHNVWMSVSDLMTGLMVIFLFIAIAYMSQVEDRQTVLENFVETKRELHDKLVNEFKGDTAKWQMSINGDLSMQFKEPTVLFAQGSSELTPRFKEILDDFLPRYFRILLNDSLRVHIQEIRIEGHTDNVPMSGGGKYANNDELSSGRALSVFYYLTEQTTLDPSKIVHTGRGQYDPIADNSTDEGRARNRRVEIKIYNPLSASY